MIPVQFDNSLFQNKIHNFYLAAGTYSGASGCTDFVLSGLSVQDCFNNAYLIIGGSNTVLTACSAVDVANSAVMGWHTQDLKVIGCTFERATQLTWNGVGSDGDSFGCVYSNGGTAITSTGGYALTAIGKRNDPVWARARRRHI